MVKRDKHGNFDIGKGFFRFRFGFMGSLFIGIFAILGTIVLLGIIFGEGTT